jgi:anti-sigma B factor antagonist
MTRAEAFAVAVDAPSGSAAIVRLTGELDVAGVPALGACLSERLAAHRDVILDLSGLSFLDSTGLGVLFGAHEQAAALGCSFMLRAPTGQVARVLQMTGTDQVFTIEPAD